MSKWSEKRKQEQEILRQMDEAIQGDEVKDSKTEKKESKIDFFSGIDNNYHCPNCNQILNNRHDVCPKCGYHGYVPMKPKETRFIRFILFGILLIVFILFMIFRTA